MMICIHGLSLHISLRIRQKKIIVSSLKYSAKWSKKSTFKPASKIIITTFLTIILLTAKQNIYGKLA
jgi:hypothetical protein